MDLPRDRSRLEIVLILGALTAFGPLSIDMYLPALPRIGERLGASDSQVQLTLASFFIGLAFGQAIIGPLTDRFGRKPPLAFGLVLFIAASAGCALARSVEWLIALRLFQALGAAAGMVVARAMVRDLFPPKEVAGVFSSLMLVLGVAPILAPMLGSQVLLWAEWPAIFWCLTAFGIACLTLATLRLQESHRPPADARLHLGTVLGNYGRLFRHRNFMGYALAGSLAIGGMFAYIAGSPFVVIELYGLSSTDYGWIFGANAFGLIGASQVNRLLLRRLTSDQVLLATTLVLAIVALVLAALAWTAIGGLWPLLVALFLYASIIGLTLPNSSALALLTQHQGVGAAAALLGVLQFGIGAAAALGVGALEDGTARPMGLVIGVCGLGSCLARRLLVRTAKSAT
jgi:MFS transporter, DHA1 family, multidrug resistance protein